MSQYPQACRGVPQCFVMAVPRARSPPAAGGSLSDEPAVLLIGTVGTLS